MYACNFWMLSCCLGSCGFVFCFFFVVRVFLFQKDLSINLVLHKKPEGLYLSFWSICMGKQACCRHTSLCLLPRKGLAPSIWRSSSTTLLPHLTRKETIHTDQGVTPEHTSKAPGTTQHWSFLPSHQELRASTYRIQIPSPHPSPTKLPGHFRAQPEEPLPSVPCIAPRTAVPPTQPLAHAA